MSDTDLQAKPQTILTPTPGGTRRRPVYVPVKNEPGKQLMIHKSRLSIDPRYQRNLNDRLVGRIMANWSWVSCGTLEVAQRPGSHSYFLIDGQHRWKAATHLPAVEELPCLMFELDTVRDEAIGFLATNVERRVPTLRDQFKALLVTGDSAAKALDTLAEQYSRVIKAPSGGGTLSCVSDCMRLLRENEAAFRRIFPIAAEISAGRPLTGRLLRGLHYLDRHMPRGQVLVSDYWRRRVAKIGYEQIQWGIKQAALYENGASDRTCANGIARVLSKGLREPLVMTANGRGGRS